MLPSKLVIEWPEDDKLDPNSKIPAGTTIGVYFSTNSVVLDNFLGCYAVSIWKLKPIEKINDLRRLKINIRRSGLKCPKSLNFLSPKVIRTPNFPNDSLRRNPWYTLYHVFKSRCRLAIHSGCNSGYNNEWLMHFFDEQNWSSFALFLK